MVAKIPLSLIYKIFVCNRQNLKKGFDSADKKSSLGRTIVPPRPPSQKPSLCSPKPWRRRVVFLWFVFVLNLNF